MSHLESGTIHALLDGEIPSAELGPIQSHLESCAECRALLESERGLLTEADGLVELLDHPVATAQPGGGGGRRWVRGLALAASLVAAVGLGWVGRGWKRPELRRSLNDQVAAPAPAPAVEPVAAPGPVPPGDAPERAAKSNFSRAKTALRRPATPVVAQKEELKARLESRDAAAPAPAPRADSGVAVKREAAVVAAQPVPNPPAPAAGAAASGVSPTLQTPGKLSGFRLDALGKTDAAPEAIGLPDAIRRLGGSLRLIEGMVPLRLEALGQTVRVVYATAQGELVLSQRLVDGQVQVSLLAPPGFSPDSLARLRSKVRE